MQPIAQELLESPVEGVNLVGETLHDELGEGDTLLVFLRHFG